ncbi:UNVERIFIED_CONTAM: hypothetical protein FKN15_000749 [Acipenser sinensis]
MGKMTDLSDADRRLVTGAQLMDGPISKTDKITNALQGAVSKGMKPGAFWRTEQACTVDLELVFIENYSHIPPEQVKHLAGLPQWQTTHNP